MTIGSPLISILINCYNSEKYLNDCLISIVNQTYKNTEIIIWDNCSKDSTAQICKKFKDNRIKYYLSTKHENLVNSRISAWKKIKGDYVAIMDSDDLSFKDRLKIQLDIIQKNSNIAAVGGGVEYINNIGKTLSYKKFPNSKKKLNKKINYKFPMNNATLFLDKKKVDELGGYSNKYEFINDFELVYRLSKKYDLVNSNEIVSKNRIHNENLSNRKFILMQTELLIFLSNIAIEINSPLIRFLNFYERFMCLVRLYKYKIFNV